MLFYFKGPAELKMVDINPERLTRQEYEIFFNKGKISKNKDGFNIFKIKTTSGGVQEFIVILGINKQCTRAVRYDEKNDEIIELGSFHIPSYRSKPIELAYYASSVYKDTEIYLVGVSNTMLQPFRTNFRISFEVDLNNSLVMNFEDFPALVEMRNDHVSFIVDGLLFVAFGDKDYFEYIDLEEYKESKLTGDTLPKFQKIQTSNINKSFSNVVVF